MAYTAKQLADISGVSVRTLHWYDKQNLLKPAYYGEDNGYRYYEKEQLLILQQILFYRELNFQLADIREIIHDTSFNKIKALEEHEVKLKNQIKRIKQLVKTVQTTILDLRGGKPIKDNFLYKGFKDWIKEEGKNYYIEVSASSTPSSLVATEEIFLKSVKNNSFTELWNKKDWKKFHNKSQNILKKIVSLMKLGHKPNSRKVQDIICAHYEHAKQFHHMSLRVYKAMAKLYRLHPEYRKQLEMYDPNLPVYISKAMEVYKL